MSSSSIPPNSNQPTFTSCYKFSQKFLDEKTKYLDLCLTEASHRVNPSYSMAELTKLSQEIATKFFEEFKGFVLTNSNEMKEQFERDTYLKIEHSEFFWKLSPDLKKILSGQLKLDDGSQADDFLLLEE